MQRAALLHMMGMAQQQQQQNQAQGAPPFDMNALMGGANDGNKGLNAQQNAQPSTTEDIMAQLQGQLGG
jgi:hypothetical protein